MAAEYQQYCVSLSLLLLLTIIIIAVIIKKVSIPALYFVKCNTFIRYNGVHPFKSLARHIVI